MNLDEVLDSLSQSFKNEEWFYEVGIGDFNRPTVYVHFMNREILSKIPNKIANFSINVHYAASKKSHKEICVEAPKPIVTYVPVPLDLDVDMSYLVQELERLEKSCGSNILQDIFYETHDGPNAVTNLSARFPDVRETLQKLYKMYGFDLIYEEMDG
jgi:hypothetical protein